MQGAQRSDEWIDYFAFSKALYRGERAAAGGGSSALGQLAGVEGARFGCGGCGRVAEA